MSKLPNFWQFFNLTSQPTIPSLYWDAYSYEERIKKICDKIWAILKYLKLVMELMNEFDDRLTVLEELYNALEARVTSLEQLYEELNSRVDQHDIQIQDLIDRVTEIENQLAELDIDGLLDKINELEQIIDSFDERITQNTNDIAQLRSNLEYLGSIVNDLEEDINYAKFDIAILTLKDSLSLKFANPEPTSDVDKTIGKNKPLVFKENKSVEYDSDSGNWTLDDPFIVDYANIEIGSWDEIVGNSVSINNINISKPAIIVDGSGSRYIIDNNHTYYLMLMICTYDGYIGYFMDSENADIVTFTKRVNEIIWIRDINKFIESSNAETTKTSSASDPNKIYYVVETEE